MSDPESDDKEFEATPRKLEDARKKGDVPIGQDLQTAAVYGAVLLIGAAFGGQIVGDLGHHLAQYLRAGDGFAIAPRAMLSGVVAPVLPLLLLPIAAVLLSVISQNGLVFAPTRLKPKLNRISPIKGAKNKFGSDGLFTFAKGAAKLVVFSSILAIVAAARIEDIVATIYLPGRVALPHLLSLCRDFLFAAMVAVFTIGLVDLMWQRASHARKNRMSRKEMMDEAKESDGDPHLKQARRQRAEAIANNRMLADVPKADVVITNPTHFAVALAWSRTPGSAPRCVAKGRDEIARRIRELASEAGIPVHQDPPTARALFATVELGAEIGPENYRPVAAAIRFADRVRRMARR